MTWDVFSADFGDFVSTLQSEAVAAVEPGSEINECVHCFIMEAET